MATDMTAAEYADKYSLFTPLERMEHKKKEKLLLHTADHTGLIRFWKEKMELFKERIIGRR